MDRSFGRAGADEDAARHVGLTYNVVSQVLNAADFGVPQKRERVFIVGFRDDLDVLWLFPEPTHSLDGLLESQWLSDDYWDRHEISARRRPPPPDRMARRIDAMWRRNFHEPGEPRPWRTVRDAFADMPSPDTGRGESGFHNHGHQPGARPYKGHTGSPLDLPAKALKAGDHGVPGGENMMVLDDDSTRYFTVREAARLQCFPDGYVFHGAWSETMRQLGNAVPVSLSRAVAASVAASLARRPNHLAHGPDPM